MTCTSCSRTYGNGGGHCTGCHESFNSDGAFDKHRTQDGDTRRCLSFVEMCDKGMLLNAKDWWITSAYTGPKWGQP